ncbi:MAG: replication protein dnaD [Firmicutes bacterium]|nr:replication protein dnaD [Bacillota bacterium]
MAGFLFPGGVLSLPREAAERLLNCENGDPALLYLSLLSRGDAGGLSWSAERTRVAWETLVRLELADPHKTPEKAPEAKPEPEGPPDYTQLDVALRLEEERSFRMLVEELQKRLGRLLSPADLKTLLILSDYLALPPEVILLLTGWCITQTEEKQGPGRRPTLSQIKKEAFRWHRQGVDTLDKAEEHIQTMGRRQEAASRLLPLLGIHGREAVDAERRYLETWNEWAFQDDAIRLAYEKTVLKKQAMNWPYMNSILRSWHQKGLRTKEEIINAEQWKSPEAPAAAAGQSPAPRTGDRLRQDMDRLDRLFHRAADRKEE